VTKRKESTHELIKFSYNVVIFLARIIPLLHFTMNINFAQKMLVAIARVHKRHRMHYSCSCR